MGIVIDIWNSFTNKKLLCIVLIGFLGFLFPMLHTLTNIIPRPGFHDEYCYILQAQTFAQGRLTNPTHPHWEHFQTFHVFHQPNYQAKYPPLQGMVLATGILLFGDEAFGIWIGNALMMMALLWCLYGWLRPRWATTVTILFFLQLGVTSYWVQTYWGGCVNAMAAALALGAVGRMMKANGLKSLMTYGCIFGLGLSLLSLSRPLEGALLGLALGLWLVVNGVIRHRYKPLGISLAGTFLILIFGLGFAAYYNHTLTGNALVMPQQHAKKWYKTLGQDDTPALPKQMQRLSERFTDEYENESFQSYPSSSWALDRMYQFFLFPVILPFCFFVIALFLRQKKHIYKRLIASAILLSVISIQWLIFFLMGFTFDISLLFALPWLIIWMVICLHPRMIWLFLILLTLILIQFLVYRKLSITPGNMHYYEALLPVFVLMIGKGLQSFALTHKAQLLPNWLRISTLILPLCLSVTAFVLMLVPFFLYKNQFHLVWDIREQTITHCLQPRFPEKDLVFVHYPDDHLIDWEVVYNTPNIDEQEVIFAQQLGKEKDAKLMSYYKDRRQWILYLTYNEKREINIKLDPIIKKKPKAAQPK